jgi:hypothetical protein
MLRVEAVPDRETENLRLFTYALLVSYITPVKAGRALDLLDAGNPKFRGAWGAARRWRGLDG